METIYIMHFDTIWWQLHLRGDLPSDGRENGLTAVIMPLATT